MSMDAYTKIKSISESRTEAEVFVPSNVSVVYSLSDRKFQIEQQISLDHDDCGGCNPYDTASLYKKPAVT
tara:strand:- start:72 stop:281 length:210 start_codon:yes stop_codon:yes gene_type:complete